MFKLMIKQVNKISNVHLVSSKPLGRWGKPKSKQIEDIKVLMANYDSCGDILCGTPKSLKKDIDKILTEKSKKSKE